MTIRDRIIQTGNIALRVICFACSETGRVGTRPYKASTAVLRYNERTPSLHLQRSAFCFARRLKSSVVLIRRSLLPRPGRP